MSITKRYLKIPQLLEIEQYIYKYTMVPEKWQGHLGNILKRGKMKSKYIKIYRPMKQNSVY